MRQCHSALVRNTEQSRHWELGCGDKETQPLVTEVIIIRSSAALDVPPLTQIWWMPLLQTITVFHARWPFIRLQNTNKSVSTNGLQSRNCCVIHKSFLARVHSNKYTTFISTSAFLRKMRTRFLLILFSLGFKGRHQNLHDPYFWKILFVVTS